mmetsp:Transcript_33178/g.105835  ORF Transcript_33178/g.105835 Transcript_33178/m.105835 type:complete len:237 (-) Transcript_33178:87-797(-)
MPAHLPLEPAERRDGPPLRLHPPRHPRPPRPGRGRVARERHRQPRRGLGAGHGARPVLQQPVLVQQNRALRAHPGVKPRHACHPPQQPHRRRSRLGRQAATPELSQHLVEDDAALGEAEQLHRRAGVHALPLRRLQHRPHPSTARAGSVVASDRVAGALVEAVNEAVPEAEAVLVPRRVQHDDAVARQACRQPHRQSLHTPPAVAAQLGVVRHLLTRRRDVARHEDDGAPASHGGL